MYFTGALPYTWQNDQVFEILKASLNNRLLDRIREELSGTYGVSCEGSLSAIPAEEYRFIVRFSTDPARVDELISAVQKEIDSFVGGSFDGKYITQIQAQLKRGTGYVYTNDFWLWNIGLTLLNGNTDFSFASLWATRPELATIENVQSMAQKIFVPENRYVFVLMPKKN
jgi:zinc protease